MLKRATRRERMKSEEFKQIRVSLGMTRAALAREMGLGSPEAVYLLETRGTVPNYHAKHLLLLAGGRS